MALPISFSPEISAPQRGFKPIWSSYYNVCSK
jgi:hypothetical protein